MNYNNPNDNWRKRQNYYERREHKIGKVFNVITLLVCLAFALLGWLLSGCTTTKYVPVIEHRTDTVRITQQQRDSLYFCDSIYTIVRTEGDTVYQQTDRWRIRYIERTSHDTIYQATHDSIPVPYKVTEYVERKRSTMDWGLTIIGTLALLGFIVWLAVKVSRILP